mmetsp:Transcript_7987/g.24669  ORF Transcript_7987/g.24669 Transcript_7987/m.24669 type:complete len:975 (-) Transcript_7987:324-3248(-)
METVPGVEYIVLHLAVIARTRAGQVVHVSATPANEGEGSSSNLFSCRLFAHKMLPMVTTPQDWPLWTTAQPIIILREKLYIYRYTILDGSTVLGHEQRVRAALPRSVNCLSSDVLGEFADKIFTKVLSVPKRKHNGAAFDIESNLEARVHIVCFHLPVRLKKSKLFTWQASWGESLIARTEGSVSNDLETQWFGTVCGARSDGLAVEAEDYDSIRTALQLMKCTPLFVPLSTYHRAYLGFCKQILWPSFHNVDILDLTCACWNPNYSDPAHVWDQSVTEHWWEAYVDLNQSFSEELLRKVRDHDVIWVHDYHLMLLPSMLSSNYVSTSQSRINIIFFLHIPFPTSQIFRSLTRGKDLLNGIVGADVVGFHAFDHARHFLNACKRLMGVTHRSVSGGLTGVEYLGRTVMVVVRHVSIEPHEIALALSEDAAGTKFGVIKQGTPFYQIAIDEGRKLLAGVDTCQRLSGVALKLLAFERFLWDYEHWRGQVALVQLVLQEGKRVDDECRTLSEISKLVARINTLFPGAVYYEVTKIGLALHERLALWRQSSIFVSTAIREGLNLAPFEYIFSRQDPLSPGLVLASEFSATAALLNGALRLNPFDLTGTAAAFDAAMSMSENERARRHARDLPYVLSRPSGKWTREILQDMWLCSSEPIQLLKVYWNRVKFVPWLTGHPSAAKTVFDGSYDTTFSFYRSVAQRIVLCDFDGNAVERGEKFATYLKPNLSPCAPLHAMSDLPFDVVKALLTLREDTSCNALAVSDISMEALMTTFCWSSIGLVACYAVHFSPPCPTDAISTLEARLQPQRIWDSGDCEIDWSRTKQAAIPLLKWFTARTSGSWILRRDPGVAWSYYRTDPEWGRVQASQLMQELHHLIAVHSVVVRHGNGIIELAPRQGHKRNMVSHILDADRPYSSSADFILCACDDEDMLESVQDCVANVQQKRYLLSLAVGTKLSVAFSVLASPDQRQVMKALRAG